MPSWINHFRVVDMLLDDIENMDMYYFLIGTIAPDCGKPTDIPGVYSPCSGVTHFTSEMHYSDKDDCDYDYVYNTYVKDETDIQKRSFYTAYFIHLFIDCMFVNEIFAPIKMLCDDFRTDYAFRDRVRLERYNIDFEYFANNECRSYELFKTCKPWNESYPSWYIDDEINWQMKNIIHHYEHSVSQSIDYKYITPKDMDDFVIRVYDALKIELDSRNIKL